MGIFSSFNFIIKHRLLLYRTTISDIKSKFAGSVFGLFWHFLYPLLLLSAYAMVYIYVFKVRLQLFDSNEYVLLIFCGLIPFLGFAEALGLGVGSVVANSSLVKNTLYPIDLVPVKAVFTAQTTQAAGLFLLLLMLGFYGKLTIWSFLIIPVWLCQILMTIGMVWLLSSINVFVRDLQSIISVIIMFLMMITPIAYTPDMVPENVRLVFSFNPLYYIVIGFQNSLILGKYPGDDVLMTLVIISFGSFIFGYWFFSKMKKLFAENI